MKRTFKLLAVLAVAGFGFTAVAEETAPTTGTNNAMTGTAMMSKHHESGCGKIAFQCRKAGFNGKAMVESCMDPIMTTKQPINKVSVTPAEITACQPKYDDWKKMMAHHMGEWKNKAKGTETKANTDLNNATGTGN